MHFLVEWSIPSQKRVECWNNFGNMTPAEDLRDCGDSIQVIGRWHRLSGDSGVCICSTVDVQALNSWMLNWSPVCDLLITPVVEDSVVRESLRGKPYYQHRQSESVEEPVEESVEEPVEEPVQEPVEEPVQEPVEEPVKKPVEESVQEPVEEPIEINVGKKVEIYSNSQECWLIGEITEIDENKNITIEYGEYNKEVTPEDYGKMWKLL